MRRLQQLSILAVPYLLPLADALSLANFQPISSSSIPSSCQLQYGTQIPSCTTDDFKGVADCSQTCQKGLLAVARSVNNACEGVNADPATLLGVILGGNIIQGLCPGATSGSGSSKSTSAAAVKSTTATTTKTKGTTPKSTESSSSSETTTSSSAASETPDAQTSSSISSVKPTQSAPQAATKSSASSTSKKAESTQNAKPATGGTGGGSPFDISSSASLVNLRSAICTIGVLLWAGIFLGA